MKPHFKTIVSSLFLLLSLYKSSTSLVGRCCLVYVNLHSDTSNACIQISRACFEQVTFTCQLLSRQTTFYAAAATVFSALDFSNSSFNPKISLPQERILNQTHHNRNNKHPPQTQCLPPSPTCTPRASSARSRKTASSAPTSTRPSPTQ